MKKKILSIVIVFLSLSVILFFFTGLLKPTWFSWNTDSTMKGIYKEPDNRIQVLFLGSSSIITGISPISLYENYGFCAYDLGTPEQPLMSSYYWLKEVEKHHPDTLNTVILDSYFIFNQDPPFEKNERALTHMKFSPVKTEAFRELSRKYGDFNYWTYLVPVFAYHSRWSQVTEDDFTGLTDENNFYFTRGQEVHYEMELKGVAAEKIDIPVYGITHSSDYTPEEYQKVWGEENRIYFKKIVEFCNEHNLNLILTALLYPGYWDLQHDALQYLADTYNIPFLDFNMVELQEEIGLNAVYDYWTPTHPNILGADKITKYIGNYINETYQITDIRQNTDYDYLSKQADMYSGIMKNGELLMCDDFERFLSLLDDGRYTVFITVQGEAAVGLTDVLRDHLFQLGFQNLADMKNGYSFAGLRDGGEIIVDFAGEEPEDIVIVQGRTDGKGKYSLTRIYTRRNNDGHFSIGSEEKTFFLVSAGEVAGDFSNMKINGIEYSENHDGLNIAVFDNVMNKFIVSSNFDTSSLECSRTDLEIPEILKNRLENERKKMQED